MHFDRFFNFVQSQERRIDKVTTSDTILFHHHFIDLTTASHDSCYSCVDDDEDTLRSFWLFVYVAPVTFF